MLLMGSKLIGIPIVGLQTGTKLASTKAPVIDPSNLRVMAYEINGPLLSERPSFIRIADVRELGEAGMIVDSSDEFVGVKDIIALQKIYELNFKLIGLKVTDEAGHKLGRVDDYSLDSDSFVIQHLNVNHGIFKSISESGLMIHRSQIIEINNHSIIVRTTAKKLEPIIKPDKLSYVNPFRTPAPQTDNRQTK